MINNITILYSRETILGEGPMFESTNLAKPMKRTASRSLSEFDDDIQYSDNNSSFYDNFDFSRGDIIFGLSSEINKYRTLWAKVSRRTDYLAGILNERLISSIQSKFIGIPDGDNKLDEFLTKSECYDSLSNEDKEFVDIYNDVIHYYSNELYESMKDEQRGWLRSFKNLFVAEIYSDFLKKHERYSFENTFVEYGEGHYSRNGTVVRTTLSKYMTRASKAGLEMFIDSTGNGQVHFILDNINLDDVVLKLVRPDTGLPSVTGSELRYLYRQRNHRSLHKKVHFYLNGKETCAPWVRNPALWKKYNPHDK